jgi:hypothetical protein
MHVGHGSEPTTDKGLEAKNQSRDSGSPGTRGGDKRRTSGGASKKSLSGKPDSTSRKDSLAGLPNVKRTPTLSEWTELLDSDVTEGGALAGGTHAQPLKEYTSGSHTSGVTSCSDIGKSTNGDTGLASGTGSPPSRSGQAIS